MASPVCQRRGSLVVLSGPSGAGKTTVYRALLSRHPEVRFSVSCTTRAPRTGETDGVDYHFIDVPRFQAHVAAGDFLEHAQVHDHWYGTLRAEVETPVAGGQDVLLDIDVQGARLVRTVVRGTPLAATALFVFCAPPSLPELRRRLERRGTDGAAVIARRLERAEAELAAWREYDYVIVNNQIAAASAELEAILLAGRCRTASLDREPWNP